MRKTVTKIISILNENLPYIESKYKLEKFELFGSYVRAEDNDNSDIDLLVSYKETPSLIEFIELENFLTDKLGIKVDLVMKNSLKRNLRQNILSEAIPI